MGKYRADRVSLDIYSSLMLIFSLLLHVPTVAELLNLKAANGEYGENPLGRQQAIYFLFSLYPNEKSQRLRYTIPTEYYVVEVSLPPTLTLT